VLVIQRPQKPHLDFNGALVVFGKHRW